MLDAGSRSEGAVAAPPRQPRAQGAAHVAVSAGPEGSRLTGLRQQGSAKCMIPRVPGAEPGRPEAVFLNTAGGITGGDRFAWSAAAGPGGALTLSTQTAERIYRAQPGQTGRVETRLTLGAGARLAWLPQETILFDRGALERDLCIEMAADAALIALEPLVLGRAAMGETVAEGLLSDRWEIRRAGRLVYADTLRLHGPVAEIAARPANFGPHRAAASLVYVAPDAEDRLERARAGLPGPGEEAEGGASAWDGMLAMRLLAPSGFALRRAIIRLLAALDAAPLPRVWSL